MDMVNQIIQNYIDSVKAIYSTGETTEHSFRGALEVLLKAMLPKKNKNQQEMHIINEPKRKTYGAPDIELRRGDIIVSFIETKDINDKDLRGRNDSGHREQFDRYKNAINTIAFTDYLEFVLFENGEEVLSSRIGKINNNEIIATDDVEQIGNFEKIIANLYNAKAEPIKSAKVLTKTLAAKAKLISYILLNAYQKNETNEDKELHLKLAAFQKFLVHDMTKEQFVDFYAQTIIYGMFIARIYDKTPASFSLVEASELIPKTIPFLKKIFKQLALADLHYGIKWIVEDLVEIFRATNMDRVLRNYGKDPLVHFYEDFLAEYNPKIREDFGVWYTPKEVVDFMVNAVDHLLKRELEIEDGLADNSVIEYKGKTIHKVQLLDPATGTGTFLATIAEKIRESYKDQEGLWSTEVVEHIIPRLNGFEYLMAPYTMAHLKLSTSLGLDNIQTEHLDRLKIYLTNSLEEVHPEENLDFAKFITDESNAANIIKRDTPVMVVVGNPPYNEKSANRGEWITNLMNDYKQEPGQERILVKRLRNGKYIYKNTLKGGNLKGLNNDYCKFIRLGQNFVGKNNEGILAYITANTYLDSRLFRGMRYNLLKSFDKIYLINLHGSTMRRESTEDIVDQCIFNIRQGVSIAIFIKKKNSNTNELAQVFYKDIYGKRNIKLNYLSGHSFDDVNFSKIEPNPPLYTFRITDSELKKQYESGFKINELINRYVQGFKSERDSIAIQFEKTNIVDIVTAMRSNKTNEELCNHYGFKNNRDWSLERARDLAKKRKQWSNYFTEVQYRPFDKRWTYFDKALITYPRPLVQSSIFGHENLSLCIGQQGNVMGDEEWSLVYCSELPVDLNINPRGGAYLFPLYVYNDTLKITNYSSTIIDKIEIAINKRLQEPMDKERIEDGFLPVDLIDYIYAILHSVSYRDTYHDFLQNDFPIIPYPESAEYFFSMAELGKKLRDLHQLKDIEQKDFITKYPISVPTDSNLVSSCKFEETEEGLGRVWINRYQYFDEVPTDAWSLNISGYQVLEKWLKDRKGKVLNSNDIRHYQKIVVALVKTMEVQEEIDDIIQL